MLGVRIKFFGQFLEKEQTERVLQVLGPMPLDIKPAVLDNPRNPTGLCSSSTYKTALPSNAMVVKEVEVPSSRPLLTSVCPPGQPSLRVLQVPGNVAFTVSFRARQINVILVVVFSILWL